MTPSNQLEKQTIVSFQYTRNEIKLYFPLLPLLRNVLLLTITVQHPLIFALSQPFEQVLLDDPGNWGGHPTRRPCPTLRTSGEMEQHLPSQSIHRTEAINSDDTQHLSLKLMAVIPSFSVVIRINERPSNGVYFICVNRRGYLVEKTWKMIQNDHTIWRPELF